ncbi:low molecular weight protein arginine phosphatase [Robertmurraya sp. DFI.2.37]|uniref:low molecular weight protein arginine phosphatase n=1 Tax=Robertmurraya sp. DFI.2.37 TaxID=3031819 RepID=UPI001247198D|nr:low molecular weight protein arginine phosphatase [Robertmurraya sp. DFI.2.37]MDF1508222.1 low molecular weight protein arginine phosphatase [Robertmurraya sp. DFI.2.37]
MTRILFVCTGNTCRSPMAEAILKSKKIPEMEVKSAGVYAMDGAPASSHVQRILEEEGIEHVHRSSMLTKGLVDWASYIFTMTESHKRSVLSMFPNSEGKVFTLKEFAGEKINSDIHDPFGGSLETYRKTYIDISENIKKIIEKLMVSETFREEEDGGEKEI